jgi:FdhD protein
VEEPLEIRLRWQSDDQQQEEPLTITMRTPGQDFELTAGLLYSEGIVRQRSHLLNLQRGDNDNTVIAELAHGHQLDLKRYQRHFYSTSSCGVCGKMAIESLSLLFQPSLVANKARITAEVLRQLPARLRGAQVLFEQTGGIHAAALFNVQGELLLLREDIGRHNALDKLLGAQFLADTLNMDDKILVVSGRAGFEIVQKALSANISILASVGAPTSLAVDMATDYQMTLVGFLTADGFNCYAHEERIILTGRT